MSKSTRNCSLEEKTKMQLDVKESTPASDVTYWFHSRIAIISSHHVIICPSEPCLANCQACQDKNYFLVLSFGQVGLVKWHQTDGQAERDAYEPTVHKHRCAQKVLHSFVHQWSRNLSDIKCSWQLPSVCLCAGMFVRALLFEPFDLDFSAWGSTLRSTLARLGF